MKKKIMLLVLVVCMLFGMAIHPQAAYAKSAAEPLADILYEEGLFQGTGMTERDEPIYQLYGSVTRAQAITMLVRILGKEDEALANKDSYATPAMTGARLSSIVILRGATAKSKNRFYH